MKSNLLLSVSLVGLAIAPMAHAQSEEVSVDPILDIRLRAEQVDQDGRDETFAATLRARFGFVMKFSQQWSVLLEGEGITHITDDFSDTVDNVPGKAVIADPEDIELNRAQISWKGEKASATVGRQRIIFDNARYIGNVGFRQNEQTFDAVRFGYNLTEDVTAEYVYIDRVRRIFGDDSPMGEFDSDSHVLRVGAKTKLGDLAATALYLDFEEAPALSSKTYALRWKNNWKTEYGKLGLHAEAAIQSEYNGNGPAQDLGFQSVGVTFGKPKLTALAGVDVLEGAGGQGYSTPLATLHAFQGWADVFLNTPSLGIRDVSVGVKGGGINLIENAKPASWAVIYHDFESDNGGLSYGRELDAVFRLPINDKFGFEVKAAHFDGADGGPADRTKFWVSLNASF